MFNKKGVEWRFIIGFIITLVVLFLAFYFLRYFGEIKEFLMDILTIG